MCEQLLIAVASLVETTGSREHRLQWLRHRGSVVAAPGVQSSGSAVMVHWPVESSCTRDRTGVPCIVRQILNHWATREAPQTFQKIICWHIYLLKGASLFYPQFHFNTVFYTNNDIST